SATPTRAILASLSGRIFEYPSGASACIFASISSRFWASGNRQISPAEPSKLVEAGLASICSRKVIGGGCGRDAIFLPEFPRSAGTRQGHRGCARLPAPPDRVQTSHPDLQRAVVA